MGLSSKLRFAGAVSGIGLWLAYPFVTWNGSFAVFQYVCEREPFVGGRDPCFSDHLPFAEMALFVWTLALAYLFARFAFTLYAPDPDRRGRGWWLASRSTLEDGFPVPQVMAAVGLLWVALNAHGYPAALYYYWIYWTAWIVWFAAGILLS